MKIGIIAAMEEEKRALVAALEAEQHTTIAQWVFHEGRIAGKEVVIVESGIGKVLAAVTATLLIEHFHVDLVINTGSAGGMGQALAIGDIVVANELAYSDADVTAFNYVYGQLPGMPERFQADQAVMAAVTTAAERVGMTVHQGLVTSADSFIHREAQRVQIVQHFPDVLAAEMEGAAIAQACYALQTPFAVVRAISDIPRRGTSAVDFDTFIVEAGRRSAQMVLELLSLI